MKKSKKEAKFFCESCGSEVPRKSKTCPMCGKFFASVRCPQCGRNGSNEDFINGCPTCGYAVNPNGLSKNSSKFSFFNRNKLHNKNKKYTSSYTSSFFTKSKRNSYSDSSLPLWIYIVSILVLCILVICLYSCL